MRDNCLDAAPRRGGPLTARRRGDPPPSRTPACTRTSAPGSTRTGTPSSRCGDWWSVVGAAGWSAPHFPTEWGGRGYSRRSPLAVRAAFDEVGALHPPGGLGLLMAAPTILTHGTPEQRERYVPDVYNGAVAWCQLFSEPGSGSDLAGLTTRAVRDGDHWIISGQKVWSSMAREADFGMLLARTDPEAPKHAGISWFAFALDQPGVTIRPLQEITGHSMFNEVFFDDAVVADADLVGGLNNGWAVAQHDAAVRAHRVSASAARWPASPRRARRAGSSSCAPATPRPASRLQSTGTVLTLPELFELARSTRPLRRPGRPPEAGAPRHVRAQRRVDGEARPGRDGARRGCRAPEPRQARADPDHEAVGRDRLRHPRSRTASSGAPTAPRPAATPRRSCSRPRRRSTAAPTRSSAT